MVFILIIVVLLFGAKTSELARGLGRSLGEFKKARDEFERELTVPPAKLKLKRHSTSRPPSQPEPALGSFVRRRQGGDETKLGNFAASQLCFRYFKGLRRETANHIRHALPGAVIHRQRLSPSAKP
jgi:TatA/E family protein of Tat protein translocase